MLQLHVTGIQLLFAYPENQVEIWLVILYFLLTGFMRLGPGPLTCKESSDWSSDLTGLWPTDQAYMYVLTEKKMGKNALQIQCVYMCKMNVHLMLTPLHTAEHFEKKDWAQLHKAV